METKKRKKELSETEEQSIKKQRHDSPSSLEHHVSSSLKTELCYQYFLVGSQTRLEISQNANSVTTLGRNTVPLAEAFVSRVAAKAYVNSQGKACLTIYSSNPLRVHRTTKNSEILHSGQTSWMQVGDIIELAYNVNQKKGFYPLQFTKILVEKVHEEQVKDDINEHTQLVKLEDKFDSLQTSNQDKLNEWLSSIHPALVEYAPCLDQEGFNTETVAYLTYDDMRELGFKMAHAKLLENFITTKQELKKIVHEPSEKVMSDGSNDMVSLNEVHENDHVDPKKKQEKNESSESEDLFESCVEKTADQDSDDAIKEEVLESRSEEEEDEDEENVQKNEMELVQNDSKEDLSETKSNLEVKPNQGNSEVSIETKFPNTGNKKTLEENDTPAISQKPTNTMNLKLHNQSVSESEISQKKNIIDLDELDSPKTDEPTITTTNNPKVSPIPTVTTTSFKSLDPPFSQPLIQTYNIENLKKLSKFQPQYPSINPEPPQVPQTIEGAYSVPNSFPYPNVATLQTHIYAPKQMTTDWRDQMERVKEYPWNIREWRKKNTPITCEAIARFFGIKTEKETGKEKKGKKKGNKEEDPVSDESTIHVEKQNLDKISIIKTTLFEHQKEGVRWMIKRENNRFHNVRGGMLCDEMGLGKTLSMLTLVALDILGRKKSKSHKKNSPSIFPTLIICSKTLITVWEAEIKRHFKANSVSWVLFHQQQGKKLKYKDLLKYDIVLTTYDTLRTPARKISNTKEEQLKKIVKQCVDERDYDMEVAKVLKKFNSHPLPFEPASSKIGHDMLFSVRWRRIICDEAHEFRNSKTKLARAVQSITATLRWFASGTPIQNQTQDLYSALKYLRMEHPQLSSQRAWNKMIRELQYEEQMSQNTDNNIVKMAISNLMLRRTKDEINSWKSTNIEKQDSDSEGNIDVESDGHRPEELKPLQIIIKRKPFATQEEKDLYSIYRGEAVELWQGYISKTSDFANVLVALTRLRQACVSPLLLPHDTRSAVLEKKFETGTPKIYDTPETVRVVRLSDGTNGTEVTQRPPPPVPHFHSLKELCARVVVTNFIKYGEAKIPQDVIDIINGIKATIPSIYSTKIKMLLKYLQKIPKKDKVLLFSEWTSIFNPLAAILTSEGYGWVRVDGTQTIQERGKNITNFEINPKVKVMLLSLKIGCAGLNLVSANHAVFLEPWWNPYVHEQAQARAHRTGQKKQVSSVYLIIEGSIEERVLEINEQKKKLAQQMLQGAVGKRHNMVALDKDTVRNLIMNE